MFDDAEHPRGARREADLPELASPLPVELGVAPRAQDDHRPAVPGRLVGRRAARTRRGGGRDGCEQALSP